MAHKHTKQEDKRSEDEKHLNSALIEFVSMWLKSQGVGDLYIYVGYLEPKPGFAGGNPNFQPKV